MPYNPLVISIGLPVIAGILCLTLPDRLKIIIKGISFIASLIALYCAAFVFLRKPVSWEFGSSVIFAADNISAFISLAIAGFALLIVLYSFGFMTKSLGRYFGYMLMTLGSALGAAYADNMIALLVFWGFLAALFYLLVNIEGTDSSERSAKKALIIIGGTDAAMIFGIALIWSMTGSFSMEKAHLPLNSMAAYIAYFSLAIASFAKAGAMPFHSWLPDAAQDGPTPVTAYLPASLDKLLGIYLLARISLKIFVMNNISNTILLIIGSVTIIAAVMIALVQHDLKRLLGYHAVSQVGYMILGIGTGNPIGIAGGLFHMLNNAVYKSCLFLNAGAVEKETRTTDLSKLGGLAKYMPVTFACFLVASLSISGIPPFNGFVSKWMIYQGIIETAGPKNPLWIIWLSAAMFGSALTVASFMKLLHAVFLGRASKYSGKIKEAGLSMSVPMVILAVTCVVFGVFAFLLPLPVFILPSIGLGLVYLGVWSPIIATVLIIIGIAAGVFIYSLVKSAKFRTVEQFVGGEDPASFERISGTEFYDTIKDINVLGRMYKKEEERSFDIYTLGRNAMRFFTVKFQRLHNGILPTYMVWCLLGMVGIFIFFFFR